MSTSAPMPISPPVTPKVMPLHHHQSPAYLAMHVQQHQQHDQQELIQLPPIKNFHHSPYQPALPPLHESPYSPTSSTSDVSTIDFLRRKSSIRSQHTQLQELPMLKNDTVFTLPSPIEILNHHSTNGPILRRGGGRVKSKPKRSPSPTTRGAFTIDIFDHSSGSSAPTIATTASRTTACSSPSLSQLLNPTNNSNSIDTPSSSTQHHLIHKKKRRSTVSSYSLSTYQQSHHPYHRHSSPQTHLHQRHQPDYSQQQQQQQPVFDTVSILNTERHVKKSKTDAAAAYDQVDIDISDEEAFKDDPRWIPNMNAFNQSPPVQVIWKGSPLNIQHMPYYNLLHPGEVNIASTLRLTPEQYLKCRRALILAAREFDKLHVNFRKSDAQKCVRIDVNKTSTLWGAFKKLGWFNPPPSVNPTSVSY